MLCSQLEPTYKPLTEERNVSKSIKIEIPIKFFEEYSEIIIKPTPIFSIETETNDGSGYVATPIGDKDAE